jgi:hypothetical protein
MIPKSRQHGTREDGRPFFGESIGAEACLIFVEPTHRSYQMDTSTLETTARQLVTAGKGILAADERSAA